DPALATAAAAHSYGSLERASLWCDPSLVEFRGELLGVLSQPEPDQPAAAKLISQFVDEAGKESAAKRQRLRLVISLAEEFYRAALFSVEAGVTTADAELAKSISQAPRWMSADGPAAGVDVCLEAYGHLDANVNQATFIEW